MKAAREQLLGSGRQRCRVHLTRNAHDLVPRSARSMVASAIRSVIEQPDGTAARSQLDRVIDGLRGSAPRVAELLSEAELRIPAKAISQSGVFDHHGRRPRSGRREGSLHTLTITSFSTLRG